MKKEKEDKQLKNDKLSLYRKYRPNSLEEFYGNDETVIALEALFKRESGLPQAFLFYGPSGCGKTTLARILKNMLNCSDMDFKEYNVANVRGIDTIREIIVNSSYSPLDGEVKIYLLDECFAKGTKVKTEFGETNIEDIKVGDKVYNILGLSTVKNVFKNKVSLNRVLKISLFNGQNIYCSKDHLFLTEDGWIKAENLLFKKVFGFNSIYMDNINLLLRPKNEILYSMQKEIYSKENNTENLF